MKQQTSKSLLPHWGSQLYSTDLLSAREFRVRGGGRRPRKAGNTRGVGMRGDGRASKVGENDGLRFHSSMMTPLAEARREVIYRESYATRD